MSCARAVPAEPVRGVTWVLACPFVSRKSTEGATCTIAASEHTTTGRFALAAVVRAPSEKAATVTVLVCSSLNVASLEERSMLWIGGGAGFTVTSIR